MKAIHRRISQIFGNLQYVWFEIDDLNEWIEGITPGTFSFKDGKRVGEKELIRRYSEEKRIKEEKAFRMEEQCFAMLHNCFPTLFDLLMENMGKFNFVFIANSGLKVTFDLSSTPDNIQIIDIDDSNIER